jgi:hypothetical protein
VRNKVLRALFKSRILALLVEWLHIEIAIAVRGIEIYHKTINAGDIEYIRRTLDEKDNNTDSHKSDPD